jgi:hypothetical protein
LLDEEALKEASRAQDVDPALVAGEGEGLGGAEWEAGELFGLDAQVSSGPGDGAIAGGEEAASWAGLGGGEGECDDALGLDLGGAGGPQLELHVAGGVFRVDDPGVLGAIGPDGASVDGDEAEDGVFGDLAAVDGGLLVDVPEDLALGADAAEQAGAQEGDAVDEVAELGADLGDSGGEDAAVMEVVTTDPQGAVLGGLADAGCGRAEGDRSLDLEGAEVEQPQLVGQRHEQVLGVATEVDRERAVIERGDARGPCGDRALARGGSLDRGLAPHARERNTLGSEVDPPGPVARNGANCPFRPPAGAARGPRCAP